MSSKRGSGMDRTRRRKRPKTSSDVSDMVYWFEKTVGELPRGFNPAGKLISDLYKTVLQGEVVR